MNDNISRTPSALDAAADTYVLTLAQLDPILATDWGLPGDPGGLPDYSPSGLDARLRLSQGLVEVARTVDPADEVDRVTQAAIIESEGASIALSEAGETLACLNNIASPIQDVRMSFDLMDKDTVDDWEQVARRLKAVPEALTGYQESLRQAAASGLVAARRQVGIGIEQARGLAGRGSGGFFAALIDEAGTVVAHDGALARDLEQGARAAQAAYGELSQMLESELMGRAPEADAVGRERYERFSRSFVGAVVDLDETYEWGLEELARIDAEQRSIAAQLFGEGVSVREAQLRLDDDESLQIHGTAGLREWMQSIADGAIEDLAGIHFDIAEPARTIEAMIAPSQDGGIYYTGPSADFSRPGRMWWSVPPGETVFHTWQERTTVFHEGVPGHHLQISQAIMEGERLNLYRRLASWNSGHGEGWALYSEALMAELGYHDELANMMGMLDSQRLRAARVALDIGVHLGKERPDGQGVWDRDFAWAFLKDNVAMADGFLEFELNRYLGWPGQAPSYKVGMRLWQQLRDDYLASAPERGEEATLRAFHSKALTLGSLPMATLRQAVLS